MEMLSSADMREFDMSLRNAVEEGSKTGSITPIVKEELKLTILNRRFKAGKGDIEREEKRPKVKFELSTEERKKKERRKEQNRRAATRCREKKKKLSEQVIQGYINEQDQKRKLEQEVESLKKEKADLQRLFDEHIFMCRRTFTPTPTQTPSYDDNTTFTFPTCSVTSPYANETEYPRDNTTPYSGGDPYDDVFSGISQYMYPTQDMTSQKTPCTAPTHVEQIDPDEEILLPDDFHLYQCTDPELEQMNGRQSISEFIDNSYMPH